MRPAKRVGFNKISRMEETMIDYVDNLQSPPAVYRAWLEALAAAAERDVEKKFIPQMKSWLDEWVPTPTPEPATWCLMLVGVGALGARLRHRRADSASKTA
jgi:hypothetical protein